MNGASSIGASGYQTLPSGLILQWGITATFTSGASQSTSFPLVFPTSCYMVQIAPIVVSGQGASNAVTAISTSAFTATNSTGSNVQQFYWFAIGK